MNLENEKSVDITVITLLSNGSYMVYLDNCLTSFYNKIHRRFNLSPSKSHYIALQEIGLSFNSLNVRVPKYKPSIIYFQWDWNLFSIINPRLFFQLAEFNDSKSTNAEHLSNIFLSM